ncbi:hypothetical protein N9Y17_00030 [Gammaproteobacteria bacterium]|nr:hypothetical protein [Gammaproteobacteria bacterium]
MKYLPLICLLVLVGCQPPSCPPMTTQQRAQQLKTITNWSAEGTLSIDQAPFSATWTYQHEANAEQLEVSGQGYFDFKASRQGKEWDIQLDDASYHGSYPNEFLVSYNIHFPITKLGDLLIGQPNTSLPSSPYGNPRQYQFTQGQATITCYTCLTGLTLPSQLVLALKHQTIQMKVLRWHVPVDDQ